jgi:hypothetical protein
VGWGRPSRAAVGGGRVGRQRSGRALAAGSTGHGPGGGRVGRQLGRPSRVSEAGPGGDRGRPSRAAAGEG